MQIVDYKKHADQVLHQLEKGAFLTVRATTGGQVALNTMTIAWGSIGYMWNRPVFTVMVRHSRHTFALMESATDFTVSLPLNGQLKQALGLCGSKSGRDLDKFQACALTAETIEGFNSPIIGECDLHLACKILYKHDMEPKQLHPDIQNSAYAQGDYHVLYYGEIVKTLKRED